MDLEHEVTLQQLQAVLSLMPVTPSAVLQRQRHILLECMAELRKLQQLDTPVHASTTASETRPEAVTDSEGPAILAPLQTAEPLAIVRAKQAWLPVAKPAKADSTETIADAVLVAPAAMLDQAATVARAVAKMRRNARRGRQQRQRDYGGENGTALDRNPLNHAPSQHQSPGSTDRLGEAHTIREHMHNAVATELNHQERQKKTTQDLDSAAVLQRIQPEQEQERRMRDETERVRQPWEDRAPLGLLSSSEDPEEHGVQQRHSFVQEESKQEQLDLQQQVLRHQSEQLRHEREERLSGQQRQQEQLRQIQRQLEELQTNSFKPVSPAGEATVDHNPRPKTSRGPQLSQHHPMLCVDKVSRRLDRPAGKLSWVRAIWGAFDELARMLEDSQALKSAAVASDLHKFQLQAHFSFLFHKVVPLLGRYFAKFWTADRDEIEAAEVEQQQGELLAVTSATALNDTTGRNTTRPGTLSQTVSRMGRRLLHGVHGLLHPPPPPECFEWSAAGTEQADSEICVAAMMDGKVLEGTTGRLNRPLSAGHTDSLRKAAARGQKALRDRMLGQPKKAHQLQAEMETMSYAQLLQRALSLARYPFPCFDMDGELVIPPAGGGSEPAWEGSMQMLRDAGIRLSSEQCSVAIAENGAGLDAVGAQGMLNEPISRPETPTPRAMLDGIDNIQKSLASSNYEAPLQEEGSSIRGMLWSAPGNRTDDVDESGRDNDNSSDDFGDEQVGEQDSDEVLENHEVLVRDKELRLELMKSDSFLFDQAENVVTEAIEIDDENGSNKTLPSEMPGETPAASCPLETTARIGGWRANAKAARDAARDAAGIDTTGQQCARPQSTTTKGRKKERHVNLGEEGQTPREIRLYERDSFRDNLVDSDDSDDIHNF
eukprot:SAG31_NODE_4_length_45662_cov_15.654622_5_plen_886_part_00